MGSLTISNAKTGQVVYSTHDRIQYNASEQRREGEPLRSDEIEIKKVERSQPYCADGFDLKEFGKAMGDHGTNRGRKENQE